MTRLVLIQARRGEGRKEVIIAGGNQEEINNGISESVNSWKNGGERPWGSGRRRCSAEETPLFLRALLLHLPLQLEEFRLQLVRTLVLLQELHLLVHEEEFEFVEEDTELVPLLLVAISLLDCGGEELGLLRPATTRRSSHRRVQFRPALLLRATELLELLRLFPFTLLIRLTVALHSCIRFPELGFQLRCSFVPVPTVPVLLQLSSLGPFGQ